MRAADFATVLVLVLALAGTAACDTSIVALDMGREPYDPPPVVHDIYAQTVACLKRGDPSGSELVNWYTAPTIRNKATGKNAWGAWKAPRDITLHEWTWIRLGDAETVGGGVSAPWAEDYVAHEVIHVITQERGHPKWTHDCDPHEGGEWRQ